MAVFRRSPIRFARRVYSGMDAVRYVALPMGRLDLARDGGRHIPTDMAQVHAWVCGPANRSNHKHADTFSDASRVGRARC